MSRPSSAFPPIANHLLAALPHKSYKRLEPSLTALSLELGQIVDTPATPARYVYFPTSAVLSMLCTMENGAMVEIGMIGNEGATAIATCLGTNTSPPHTIVQVAGDALRIRASKLKAEFDRGGALQDVMLSYIRAFVTQISQSVGCNTHHQLGARLSRWLLIVRDRVPSDELLLQHEFLSQMLGTGRSAVTIAAGALRDAGLIRYARGKIAIVDRPGLEASACECYGVVKAAFATARLG
jgi:hypothetical protein